MDSMKDIGHYAGFLSQKEQDEITNASLSQLYDLSSDILIDLWMAQSKSSKGERSLFVSYEKLGSLKSISLIRGLCDRIELKLMEVAE